MSLAKMVDTLEWTFITLAKVREELSKTHKVEYLGSSAATEWLHTAKMMILRDDEKMNDFVKAKNFLLLNDGCSDSGKKRTHGISAVKSIGQKKKPKKLSTAKKALIDDYDPLKDCSPNKEFWALSPNSCKKWNEHRMAAWVVGALTMTSTTGDSDDEKIPPHFDPEMYKMAMEHAQKMIARIKIATTKARLEAKSQPKQLPTAKKVLITEATVLKDSNDSDESEEEVTPSERKKNAGQQFGCKGCHHKD